MTGMFSFQIVPLRTNEQAWRERHVGNGRRRGRPREVPRDNEIAS